MLWLCLLVLLWAFLFGLIKFKGNFVEYVQYLNSIEIKEILSLDQDQTLDNPSDDEVFDEALLDNSGSLDDDYFLPEVENLNMDDNSFGFSGSLESEIVDKNKASSPTISKEDLVNLIKSNEK